MSKLEFRSGLITIRLANASKHEESFFGLFQVSVVLSHKGRSGILCSSFVDLYSNMKIICDYLLSCSRQAWPSTCSQHSRILGPQETSPHPWCILFQPRWTRCRPAWQTLGSPISKTLPLKCPWMPCSWSITQAHCHCHHQKSFLEYQSLEPWYPESPSSS